VVDKLDKEFWFPDEVMDDVAFTLVTSGVDMR
jgi:hypothetical protein